jgi:hypothetical protein
MFGIMNCYFKPVINVAFRESIGMSIYVFRELALIEQ